MVNRNRNSFRLVSNKKILLRNSYFKITKSYILKNLLSIILILFVSLILLIGCKSEKENVVNTENRPNILLLVADDMGLSDIGPFGSEIQTPALNKLAEQSILMSNFHVLPKCSPSRSVLLSGTDNHIAGLGERENEPQPIKRRTLVMRDISIKQWQLYQRY